MSSSPTNTRIPNNEPSLFATIGISLAITIAGMIVSAAVDVIPHIIYSVCSGSKTVPRT